MKKSRKILFLIMAIVTLLSVVFGIYKTSYARAEDIIYLSIRIIMRYEVLALIKF